MQHNCEWNECRANRRRLFLIQELLKLHDPDTLQKVTILINQHPFSYKREYDGAIGIVTASDEPNSEENEMDPEKEVECLNRSQIDTDDDDELAEFREFCRYGIMCTHFSEFWKGLEQN